MSWAERAAQEEALGDLQEATAQRLHAVAELLLDPQHVHQRADQLSARAHEHYERARRLRAQGTA